MTTRGRGTPRECPVTTREGVCKSRVAPGRICCRFHWQQVPTALRTAYWKAWGTWQETHADADWDATIDARTAALSSVNVARP